MPSLRSLTLLATALYASLTAGAPAPQASAPVASVGAPAPQASTSAAAVGAPAPQASTSAASIEAPAPQASTPAASTQAASGSFWLGAIDHTEDTVYMGAPDYKVFRNVVEYGADPTGADDSTAFINKAISDGDRCGGAPTGNGGCDSSTVHPAIIYFPPGTYKISKAILMYYYTQMIGDANDPPTLLATDDFEGMAVLDADPYDEGANWFTNQNNFFRQVRNFVIDIRQIKGGTVGAGIHWQVAQATSLQNINFVMSEAAGTQQQGVFMDNGSGGFFSDLTFNGGNYGVFLGSQQFTSRNLTFNNCNTAIFMNWNWGWTFHGITINGGTTGIDMGNGPANQTVGSVVISDSKFSNLENGVKYSRDNAGANVPDSGNTLFLDNVDMTSTPNAVVDRHNATVLTGNTVITAWADGHGYNPKTAGDTYAALKPNSAAGPVDLNKPASLLDSNSMIVSRSKPQYEDYTVNDFLSAKAQGCHGNGIDDDTEALQAFLTKAATNNQIAYFPHGAYLVSKTVTIPAGSKIVGSVWSLLMANGNSSAFNDVTKPSPVFRVGAPNDHGSVEIQDVIFQTKGAAPGAIMLEWNLQSEPGASGMWDAHVRIGGSAGTGLEGSDGCGNNTAPYNPDSPAAGCQGVFLMFHATNASSGIYLENTWFWVADHNLDEGAPNQISIYSARGALFENSGPAWLWGTASEHSVIYNYQMNGVGSFFGGFMQTETPYFQPNPDVTQPFKFNSVYDDPTFTICKNDTSSEGVPCKDAWGMRILNSKDVLIYGTGMYSFFNNYEQPCVAGQNCQENMIRIQNSQVQMFAVSTKAAVNMIVDENRGSVLDEDNRSNFCATLGYYITDR